MPILTHSYENDNKLELIFSYVSLEKKSINIKLILDLVLSSFLIIEATLHIHTYLKFIVKKTENYSNKWEKIAFCKRKVFVFNLYFLIVLNSSS